MSIQIQGRPGTDTEWSIPFEEELKNMTKQIANYVNVDNSEYATAAKNNLNTFVDSFKSELAVFTKSVCQNSKYFSRSFLINSFTTCHHTSPTFFLKLLFLIIYLYMYIYFFTHSLKEKLACPTCSRNPPSNSKRPSTITSRTCLRKSA